MTYGYIRVSTDKQTVENQRNAIKEAGYQIDEWLSDQGVSGTKDWKKRDIKNAVDNAKEGDRIVVAELSRLGRSLANVLELIETCRKKKVELVILRENIRILDGDPTTKLLIAIIGALAEMERDLISMRTKDALNLRRERGVILGRPKGRKSSHTKLTGREDQILDMLEIGCSKTMIAEAMSVDRNTLRAFCQRTGGKLWETYANTSAPTIRKKKRTDRYGHPLPEGK